MVKPDVALPGNGLTLAILREFAAVVVALGASGVKAIPDLAGKRLDMLAGRTADRTLLRDLLAHDGLELLSNPPTNAVGEESFALVFAEGSDAEAAFRDGRIDTMALETTPTLPAVRRAGSLVGEAGEASEVAPIGFPDTATLLAR